MAGHIVTQSTRSKKTRFFYGYIVVIAAFITMTIAFGTLYGFGVFFKPLSTELGWTRAMTSGAYSLSYILLGLLSIVVGRLNDRFGPRIIVVGCGFFLGLGYLLMSQISTIWQLYLFYGIIIGVGMSASFVPLLSTVARWFVKRRGLMTGIVSSGIGIGTLVVPVVASQLIASHGWRISYLIVGIISLVGIIIAAQFLKRDPSQIEELPYGESEVKEGSPISETRGFSLREALYTRQFWTLCALYFCHALGQQAIFVHIVPHATDLGVSPTSAVNILALIGGFTILGTVVMGSVIDRIGNRSILIIALGLVTAVLFSLTVAKELGIFYLLAAIFGFGFGGTLAAQSPIVAELFGLRAHGVILGIVAFSVTIGGAFGPLFSGRLFDITGSYYLAFLISGVIQAIGLILVLLLKPIRRENLM